MSNEDFFEEQLEQSDVKTRIVHEYFWIWAHILGGHLKRTYKHENFSIGYVDLYSGPGRYKDGTKSTPLIILETAINNPLLSKTLKTYFNDKKPENYRILKQEIDSLPNIAQLKHQPDVKKVNVDDSLAGWINQNIRFPTLFFFDPCGYKGLSINLIKAAIKGFGNDCIFFFNYNRINQHLSNPKMNNNMNVFFGAQRAEELRNSLQGQRKNRRKELIIEALKNALKEHGGIFSHEYCFKKNNGKRISHFLIFVTKSEVGLSKMKEVMGRQSSSNLGGVPSYEFNPNATPNIFDLFSTPIEDLAEDILQTFASRTVKMRSVYREHHIGKQYIFINYQDALKLLESRCEIIIDPPASQRMKGGKLTLSRDAIITFPSKED